MQHLEVPPPRKADTPVRPLTRPDTRRQKDAAGQECPASERHNLLLQRAYRIIEIQNMAAHEDPTELEAWFTGKVQGVGFRYETLGVARGYAVTGYVENLPDGRVHLVASGERDEADAFLAALQDRMSDYIRETESRHQPPGEGYTEFRIRR